MAILKIAKLGHPILCQKSEPVDNISDPNIKKLIHDMSETMIDYNGIGLAATQVHISKRIIIFRNPDKKEKDMVKSMPKDDDNRAPDDRSFHATTAASTPTPKQIDRLNQLADSGRQQLIDTERYGMVSWEQGGGKIYS